LITLDFDSPEGLIILILIPSWQKAWFGGISNKKKLRMFIRKNQTESELNKYTVFNQQPAIYSLT